MREEDLVLLIGDEVLKRMRRGASFREAIDSTLLKHNITDGWEYWYAVISSELERRKSLGIKNGGEESAKNL